MSKKHKNLYNSKLNSDIEIMSSVIGLENLCNNCSN